MIRQACRTLICWKTASWLICRRDNIGPVNLRAEAEMEDVTTRITHMETERDDLLAAIAKLRAAISKLNREGRERLLKSLPM